MAMHKDETKKAQAAEQSYTTYAERLKAIEGKLQLHESLINRAKALVPLFVSEMEKDVRRKNQP